MKPTQCTPTHIFQLYQEHSKRHHGLGDLNMTNETNKLASFMDRLHSGILTLL